MKDVDIDPFREHDKTELHPDDTGENIHLNPGEQWEDYLLGNQNRNNDRALRKKMLNQVILAGTLTGVQGDNGCKVLAALHTVKELEQELA